jgi:putative nucleotidyltransferase with HDIG domain
VHPVEQSEPLQIVVIRDVLIGDGTALHEGLREHLASPEVADRVFAWIKPRLESASTLQLDEAATRRDQDRATAVVEPVLTHYRSGQTLVKGKPLSRKKGEGKGQSRSLDKAKIDLLRAEYEQVLAERPTDQRIARGAAVIAMIFAMFVLCGIYLRYRQRGPLASLTRLSVILALAVITVALARWASVDPWRAEIIPVTLFGMTMAIVYRQELAVLFSAVLALVVVLAIGQGLHEFLLVMGVTTTANLNLGQIRSRAKLIYVGLFAGGVAILLDIGLGMIDSQPFDAVLLQAAARDGLWALTAGFLMTGLLPFVEKLFGVLTDLSLLELGDVSHPLLQELIRRAPSTYNHSVTVGSIAEAAADSIGARGLLVRVGAYFHDIGKMLKPGYFIENQGAEANRHETLVPAMSTLVIVAHIKDGADLARQRRLPQPIIDLIEQHHGTTLVGYFYERATERKQSDPDGSEVDESTFRYPGPKPQTKEAAVLMLADNVESASRTLVDPTPARIERLVREVAQRRLHGGQFDESGLTLRELRTIEKSMVMSLTSIYHGRIKYPDQRTA